MVGLMISTTKHLSVLQQLPGGRFDRVADVARPPPPRKNWTRHDDWVIFLPALPHFTKGIDNYFPNCFLWRRAVGLTGSRDKCDSIRKKFGIIQFPCGLIVRLDIVRAGRNAAGALLLWASPSLFMCRPAGEREGTAENAALCLSNGSFSSLQ